jgi:hypothetical protein
MSAGAVSQTVATRSRYRRISRTALGVVIVISAALAWRNANADGYISPSGYLQVVGYQLVRAVTRDGAGVALLAGRVEALADCDGATVTFDVLDDEDRKLGEIRLVHGPLYRHDVWPLESGELVPAVGTDLKAAVAGAKHVLVREAVCSRRR